MGYEVKNLRGLYICEFVMILLIFIFSIILYLSNQFKDGVLRDLSTNWKMNPISKISINSNSNSKNNGLNRHLGIYPNKNYIEFIKKWRKIDLEIETLESYNYYNVYNNDESLMKCGKDDEGNYLYFPEEIGECPINFIEITNNKTPSFEPSKCKTIILTNNKYLHYSNKNTDGKILVQLQISQHYPCPNIDYDNNFCPILNICENKDKVGCHLVDYLSDKYNYEYLDHDLAENLLTDLRKTDDMLLDINFKNIQENTGLIKNNDIKEKTDSSEDNYYALDSDNNSVFILYKRSWIGYYSNLVDVENNDRNVKKKLKNFVNMEKFCRRKNRTLLAHSILIFIFVIGKFFSDKIFKNKDYFIFVDILTLIFLFVDITLNSVTISRYYSFDSYFFKYSIFNYFKHNENKLIKIETWLLIFNCIIFIIEFLLFLFDFYQLENCCNKHNINISNCCRKCMNPINEFFDVKNVDDKTKERTDTNEDLLKKNENNNLIEINISKKSRIEKELSAKFKKMNENDLENFKKNIMEQFEDKRVLDVIEEEEYDNESISNNNNNNNDYVKLKEYILDNNNNNIINNNDENKQDNITIYNKNYVTILKNNDEENKDNKNDEEIENKIKNLSVSKNINFSQLKSEALQFQQIRREDTPQGHFGYIKKFQIKGNNKLFVLKKPLLKEENGVRGIKEQNLIKIEEINLEIELLKQFKHKNIIKCFGRRLKDNEIPCMVLENCEGGDLKTALKNNNVSNEFKIKMMKELAEALIYLHKKGYVHSDLKCDNILLDKPYNEDNYPNLKLSDFGCAVKVNEKFNNGHKLYRAIEAILDNECIVTDKLDVYSYASTCYEIIKEEPPFEDNIILFNLLFAFGNYYPAVSSLNCSDEMKKLLLKCWNKNPEERPDMINVLKILNEINIF